MYIVELDVPDLNQTVDCILKHLIIQDENKSSIAASKLALIN